MKALTIFCSLCLLSSITFGQHTFSIVAVDSVTGEIGSAGATCGDSIIWPGTPGAYIISDVIPGVGAIHTQSYYLAANQNNANNRMDQGDSPQEIIDWLTQNDVASNPSERQYGIVDYNGGSPRAAAYTGTNCMDYKNHIVGPNYAIQGNILLNQQILDSMEEGFNNTSGCLSDKLMGALQGANVVGADSRCTSEGTSSLSAFIRVADPNDHPDTLKLDINVAGTATGVEPINVVQSRYDQWKQANPGNCSTLSINRIRMAEENEIEIYPNPSNGEITVEIKTLDIKRVYLYDMNGKLAFKKELEEPVASKMELSFPDLEEGVYLIRFISVQGKVTSRRIVL